MKKVNINDIKVSSKLDDVIKNAINEGYKNKSSKNNKRIKRTAIAVVATLVITLFATSFSNEVFANVKLAMFDIGNFLRINKDLDDYKTVVNSSVSENGITVQLNEVILDKDEIIISTTVKSDTKLGAVGGISPIGSVYINNEKISGASGGGSKQIDEYTTEAVLSYNLDKNLPNGDLNIEIKYTYALIIGGKEIEGPWTFKFKANGDALAINTKQVKLNNSFLLENGQKITLNEYRSNDIGQKIYYSVEGRNKPYSLILKGHDDLGNEVSFYSSYESYEDGIMKDEIKVSDEAKTLTLAPYTVPFPEKSGRMSNDYKQAGEEFTIKLD